MALVHYECGVGHLVKIGRCGSCGEYTSEIWKEKENCPSCGGPMDHLDQDIGTLEHLPRIINIGGLILIVLGMPVYSLIKIQHDKRFLEKFYNTFSPLYDVLSPLWYGSGRRGKVISDADIRPGDIVLDYGCATGSDILELSRMIGKKGKIVAVDISVRQLERSVEKIKKLPGMPNVAFVKEGMELVPFESGTFDKIVSVGVLSYQEDPTKLLSELRRTMKRGGRISVLDFGRILLFPRHKYLKSTNTIKSTFNKAKFKEIDIEKRSGLLCEYYYITAVK